MTDTLTTSQRSTLMSRVKGRNTTIEHYVRKTTWAAGFRYRLNVRRLPAAPDLVFARHKAAVLVQGCFWHGHDCAKGRKRPKSNIEFWNRKLDDNLERDARNQRALRDLGWKVFLIWECRMEKDTEYLMGHLRARSHCGHGAPFSSVRTACTNAQG